MTRVATLRSLPRVAPWLLLLACTSCIASSKTSTVQPPAPQPQGPTPEETQAKFERLARELEVAKAKLAKTVADVGRQQQASAETVASAELDLALSQRALGQFEERSAKIRLERAKLDLAQSQDYFEESKEELAQLELMYEKTDFADKTKEMVIRRGQRRLERAQRGLELQKRNLDSLEAGELPQERAKLQADLEAKTRALTRARREAESALGDRELARLEQSSQVARLEAETAAAQRGGGKKESAR